MFLALPTVDQMTDILDLKPLERYTLFWFWLVLTLLILAGVAYLIFLYLKHRKKEEAPVEVIVPEKVLTPSDRALEAFGALEKLGLLEKRQYRKYYFGLSEILKVFLEEEFKIGAIDATTEETIPLLRSSSLTSEQKSFIEMALQEMDLVKFAKGVPDSKQVASLRRNLRDFFDRPPVISVPSNPPSLEGRELEGG